MKKLASILAIVLGLGLGLAVSQTAAAQTAPTAPIAPTAPAARSKCSDTDNSSQGEKTKYEVVIGPDGKKIFRIKTGFVICGKVPKPDVLYGLLNTTINYEWETLKQDFMPKILHTVEENPF